LTLAELVASVRVLCVLKCFIDLLVTLDMVLIVPAIRVML